MNCFVKLCVTVSVTALFASLNSVLCMYRPNVCQDRPQKAVAKVHNPGIKLHQKNNSGNTSKKSKNVLAIHETNYDVCSDYTTTGTHESVTNLSLTFELWPEPITKSLEDYHNHLPVYQTQLPIMIQNQSQNQLTNLLQEPQQIQYHYEIRDESFENVLAVLENSVNDNREITCGQESFENLSLKSSSSFCLDDNTTPSKNDANYLPVYQYLPQMHPQNQSQNSLANMQQELQQIQQQDKEIYDIFTEYTIDVENIKRCYSLKGNFGSYVCLVISIDNNTVLICVDTKKTGSTETKRVTKKDINQKLQNILNNCKSDKGDKDKISVFKSYIPYYHIFKDVQYSNEVLKTLLGRTIVNNRTYKYCNSSKAFAKEFKDLCTRTRFFKR